jgi:hypothetical protein
MKRLVLLALPIVLAACGQTNPHLIPQSNAQSLNAKADQIADACAKGDKSGARQGIREARQLVESLPRTVSVKLKENLGDWLTQINSGVGDCQGEATATPTETQTEAPTETASPTETPTPAATSTPTPTATPTVTQAPTDTATPNQGGGVPAPTATPGQ